MYIYAARDIVSPYMTLHLLLKILFVAVFGVLSLLMLFLLHCLLELLYVMHGYSSVNLFTRDELVCVICHLSTS